jgi:hypothetical protein
LLCARQLCRLPRAAVLPMRPRLMFTAPGWVVAALLASGAFWALVIFVFLEVLK